MDSNRTRSRTEMLSELDWGEANRGIGYREGRARSLFSETALKILESALAAIALRGEEALLISLAEEAAELISLEPSIKKVAAWGSECR